MHVKSLIKDPGNWTYKAAAVSEKANGNGGAFSQLHYSDSVGNQGVGARSRKRVGVLVLSTRTGKRNAKFE